MSDKEQESVSDFGSLEEKLIWLLHQMIRSSRIRGDYFKIINDFYSQYIISNTVTDQKTGVVTEDKEIYDAIHGDLIFRVLGVIESFQGAMAAAWKYTATGRRNLEEILPILIDPRGHRGDIQKRLRKNNFTEKTICRMFAIQFFTRFKKETRDKLRILLNDTFHRIMDCAWYSQKFWDAYEDIRNIHAHNFRFIFSESIEPGWKAIIEESVLCFVKDTNDILGTAFIGASQRVAMSDLVYLLLELERWIYNNLRNNILNDCKSVLPKYIPYLEGEQRDEYQQIWREQGYKFSHSPVTIKTPIRVDYQAILVAEFLGLLDKWGRSLRVYGKDGKEFRFPVKNYQQDLEKRIKKIKE